MVIFVVMLLLLLLLEFAGLIVVLEPSSLPKSMRIVRPAVVVTSAYVANNDAF